MFAFGIIIINIISCCCCSFATCSSAVRVLLNRAFLSRLSRLAMLWPARNCQRASERLYDLLESSSLFMGHNGDSRVGPLQRSNNNVAAAAAAAIFRLIAFGFATIRLWLRAEFACRLGRRAHSGPAGSLRELSSKLLARASKEQETSAPRLLCALMMIRNLLLTNQINHIGDYHANANN